MIRCNGYDMLSKKNSFTTYLFSCNSPSWGWLCCRTNMVEEEEEGGECEFSSWCLGSAACAARACLLATVFKGTTRQRQRQMHLEKTPKNQSWYLRPAAACAGLQSTACPCSQTGIPQNTVFALNDDDGNYDNDDNDDDVDDEDNNKGDDVAWQQWVGSGLEWWQWWCWG